MIAWRIIIAPAMLGIATNLVVNPAARADPGIFDDRIVFGQSAVFEGSAAALGLGMREGILAAFREANTSGGVNGRRLELLSRDGNRVGASEPREAVKSINALRGITGLLLLGHRVSEGAFEGDEFGPADPKLACYPVTPHAACSINGLGTTDKHFLGITSTQCTSSAERAMIHDGNRSTHLSDPRTRDLSGGARSNHH